MPRFKYHIVILLTAVFAFTVQATTFDALIFVKTDGTTISFSTQGLRITYDDFAHAVITNDEISATLDLHDLGYMYFGDLNTSVTGDINEDGEVNITDINLIINTILGYGANPSADVNGDGEINITDINTIIDIILNH